jgi:catechol 2,3-dioxygenase-like lactoylglutathione lyase family enzyme
MPRLDHVNIHTRDAAVMIDFLKTLLGAEEGYRPPFGMPGHWLYLEGHPAIHLNVVERQDDFPQGMLNHAAFAFFDRDDAINRATATGYRLEHDEIPGAGIGQIFVYGPEGIRVELQYRQ